MKKTALYISKLVYIYSITNHEVWVSYSQDLKGKFKVDIKKLKDIKFEIN